MLNLKNFRKEYKSDELSKTSVHSDPLKQFDTWFAEAISSGNPTPDAMVLSTVSHNGRPTSRVVLLKQVCEGGFDFYTNYLSKKGKHLKDNSFASLVFYWPELERQVRVEGKIYKLEASESDEYFMSRPFQSQIGAWASPQSTIIPNRKTLLDWYEEFENIFKTTAMTRPAHWGGYRLAPDLIEFWQGRENRLNDRIEYIKKDDTWEIHRLAP
jgi:pyridoxamine 5'-phosphate oxidase